MAGRVITIDGPAGSGKSTIAKIVAARLGWSFLDSGAMYRALCLAVKEGRIDPEDAEKIETLAGKTNVRLEAEKEKTTVFLNGKNVTDGIRSEEISKLASVVSAHENVRKYVVAWQREFASRVDTVAEGRDMGTVVFPNALYKFYLDATSEERAGRRRREIAARGEKAETQKILRDIRERDERDKSRKASPLVVPKDAIVIDTTGLSIGEAAGTVLSYIGEV